MHSSFSVRIRCFKISISTLKISSIGRFSSLGLKAVSTASFRIFIDWVRTLAWIPILSGLDILLEM